MFWKLQLPYSYVCCVASKPIANSQLDRSELEKDQSWSKHVAEYIKWSQCPKRTCDNKNKSWIQSPSIWSRQNILSRGLEIQPLLVLCFFLLLHVLRELPRAALNWYFLLLNNVFVLRNPPWCEEVLFTATGFISKRKCFNLESNHTIPDFTGVTLVREDTSW